MSTEDGAGHPKGRPSKHEVYELDWEELPKAELGFDGVTLTIFRTRVPGGWLVYGVDGSSRGNSSRRVPAGLTFIPDASHGWDGNSEL